MCENKLFGGDIINTMTRLAFLCMLLSLYEECVVTLSLTTLTLCFVAFLIPAGNPKVLIYLNGKINHSWQAKYEKRDPQPAVVITEVVLVIRTSN